MEKNRIPGTNYLVELTLKILNFKKDSISFTSPIKIYREGLYEHDTQRIYLFKSILKFTLKCIGYLIIAIIGLFIFVLLIDFFANVDLDNVKGIQKGAYDSEYNRHKDEWSIFNN